MKYLDASIPLTIFLGEPVEKLEACRQIVRKIERGEERAATSAYTVAEILHILMRREQKHPAIIVEMLERFLESPGLRLTDALGELCLPALKLALKREVDFVDAHHVLTMQSRGIREIYSIDPHFDKFPEIRGLEGTP